MGRVANLLALPEWSELQDDPERLSRARERLLEAHLREDPRKLEFFQKQPVERQRQLYEKFMELVTEQNPDRFQVVYEPAGKREEYRPSDDGARLERQTVQVKAKRRPIFDPATEKMLKAAKSGELKLAELNKDSFLEAGEMISAYVPEARERIAEDAQRRAQSEFLPDDPGQAQAVGRAAATVGGYTGPLVRLTDVITKAAGRPKDSPTFEGVFKALNAENQRLLNLAYPETRGFQVAGALLGFANISLATAGALKSAGVNLVSRKGIALGSTVDALAAGAYAPEAPGVLAAAAGKPESFVWNAAEQAIFSTAIGFWARAVTRAGHLKRARDVFSKRGIEFKGTDKELIEYLRDLISRMPKPVEGRARTVTPKVLPEPTAEEIVTRSIEREQGRRAPLPPRESPAPLPPREQPVDPLGGVPELPPRERPVDPLGGMPELAPDELAVTDAPVVAVAAKAIASRPGLMQFKKVDVTESGINLEDRIADEADWDDRKAGNLLLWQPEDPERYGLDTAAGERYIVANGHHRLEFGQRKGREAFNAQIIREADGWSVLDARVYAAEINIADGKGTIYDQAKFIRNQRDAYGEDEALARAKQTGARGRNAAAIALDASDNLFTAFINEQINPAQTTAIAEVAPKNDGLQRIGIQQALRGAEGENLKNFLRAVQSEIPEGGAEQVDLFGGDDSAIKEMERLAARALAFQREVGEQIAAVLGAAKRPEKARALGVNVADPEALGAKITELRELRERWKSWHMDEALTALVKGDTSPEAGLGGVVAVEEPGTPYAIDAAKRLKALYKRKGSGALSPAEELEVEELEVQMGQDFFEFYDRGQGRADAIERWEEESRQARDLRQGEIAAKQEERLLGDDLTRQLGLFDEGAPLDEEGQGMLFSPRRRYERDPRQQELDLEIEKHLGYLTRGGDEARSVGRERAGGELGTARSQKGADYFKAETPIQVTARLFSEKLAYDRKVDFIGAPIGSPEELALHAQVLRNPAYETFYIIALRGGRVWNAYAVTSRLPGSAATFGPGGSPKTIKQFLEAAKADEYYMLHNHPSGKVNASRQDIQISGELANDIGHTGFRGHVIINHGKYNWLEVKPAVNKVYGRVQILQNVRDLPGAPVRDPHKAREGPPEATKLLERTIREPGQVALLGQEMQAPDQMVSLFFRQASMRTSAAATVAIADFKSPKFPEYAREVAHASGAIDILAYYGGSDTAVVRDRMVELVEEGVLLDGAYAQADYSYGAASQAVGTVSARGAWMGTPKSAEEGGTRIMQEPGPYGQVGQPDYRAPIAYRLLPEGKGGRAIPEADTSWVKVELGGIELVRPVEMPELVELTKALGAEGPILKLLPKSYGLFRAAGDGQIVLDKRIFRDARFAQTVLAHEIGHLVDYVPQQAMERGNILGRLAVMRNYLAHTIDELPTDPSRVLTPRDRAGLRRRARKDVKGRGPALGGKEELNAVIAERYTELVDEEIEARGLVTQAQVRKELIDLSFWWRPLDPAKVPEWFVQYRESSPELYADAVSILFNAPAEWKQRGPLSWKMFFNYLERKKSAKEDLVELWEMLSRPYREVLHKRQDLRLLDYAEGDELYLRKAKEREERYKSFRGWWDRFRQEIGDVFTPIVQRAQKAKAGGATIERKWDPDYVFDEHPLADGKVYSFLQDVYSKVITPLEGSGFTQQTLGDYLFLNRVLNEREVSRYSWGRSELANPRGETPATARKALMEMRVTYGAEAMEQLENLGRRFQDQVFRLMRRSHSLGILSDSMFETIKQNRYNYVTFSVLDYIEDFMPVAIHSQTGTLKGVGNPFTFTTLKMVSVLRLHQWQKAKLTTVRLLQEFYKEEIREGDKFWNGRTHKYKDNSDPEGGQIDLLWKGREVRYYVPKDVAESLDGVTPARASAMTEVMNWVFRKVFYPLWITYNPVFQLFTGPMRDARRSFVNLPAKMGARVAAEAMRNYRSLMIEAANKVASKAGAKKGADPKLTPELQAVRDFLTGRPNPIIKEMIGVGALGTPYDAFTHGTQRQDALAQMQRKFQLLGHDEVAGKYKKAFSALLRTVKPIEFAGLTFEMLPKVKAYQMLTRELGWPKREAGAYVNNYLGVPNFREQGKHTRIVQSYLPFFQVFLKGFERDLGLAAGRQRFGKDMSAPAWWMRYMASDGLWTVMQALGTAGVLGAGIKEWYDSQSEYNKTNYNLVPIGFLEGGEHGKRGVGLRVPRDETSRLISGMIHKAIVGAAGHDAGAWNEMAAFGSGQIPTVNPVVELGSEWISYVSGQNPIDDFRGKPILSNHEYLTGGWTGFTGMLEWSYDQTGLQNFVRWNPRAETVMEMAVSGVPVLNRFMVVSDYGYRELQDQAAEEMSRERHMARAAMPKNVRRVLAEYYGLRGIRTQLRSEAQAARMDSLGAWYRFVFKPNEELLLSGEDAGPIMTSLEEATKAFEE